MSFLNKIAHRAEMELTHLGDNLLPHQWMSKHMRHPKHRNRPFSFAGHEYQIGIVDDPHPHQVDRKASQLGITEITINTGLRWNTIYQPTVLIYTMPTKTMLDEFSKLRLRPLLDGFDGNTAIGDESAAKQRNSLTTIQIGASWFLFHATMSERQSIGTSADFLIRDELDKSDLANIKQFPSRIEHSPYGWIRDLANPRYPGIGVSADFDVSSESYWQIRCPYCGTWQKALWEPEDLWNKELNGLPFIVKRRETTDALGRRSLIGDLDEYCYACTNPACRRELKYDAIAVKNGELQMNWIHDYELPRTIKGKKHNIRGRQLNHIAGWAWKSAQSIVDKFWKYDDLTVAYSMVLGLPFQSGFAKIYEGDVRACQSDSAKWEMKNHGLGPVISWDQGGGSRSHYIAIQLPVVTKDGKQAARLLYAENTSEYLFDQIVDGVYKQGRIPYLYEKYGCVLAVGDAQPNAEGAEALCREGKGKYYRVFYIDSQHVAVNPKRVDPEKPDYIINANRSMCLDKVARFMKENRYQLPDLDNSPNNVGAEILNHLTSPNRIIDTHGNAKWIGSTDHFFHTLSYGLMAFELIGSRKRKHVCQPGIVGVRRR